MNYTENTAEYVIVNDEPFATDTESECEAARDAMREAGIAELPVYHGHPECPDSYRGNGVIRAD